MRVLVCVVGLLLGLAWNAGAAITIASEQQTRILNDGFPDVVIADTYALSLYTNKPAQGYLGDICMFQTPAEGWRGSISVVIGYSIIATPGKHFRTPREEESIAFKGRPFVVFENPPDPSAPVAPEAGEEPRPALRLQHVVDGKRLLQVSIETDMATYRLMALGRDPAPALLELLDQAVVFIAPPAAKPDAPPDATPAAQTAPTAAAKPSHKTGAPSRPDAEHVVRSQGLPAVIVAPAYAPLHILDVGQEDSAAMMRVFATVGERGMVLAVGARRPDGFDSPPAINATDTVVFKDLRFQVLEKLEELPNGAGQGAGPSTRAVHFSLIHAYGDRYLALVLSVPEAELPDARAGKARRKALLELLDQAVVSIEE